ncbi:MAG: M1 family metallopeptidase [Candidatus Aminicenantes bacterium]|nr:M1 family metallopeptidase [Candidatus Aminicenantes bacterium]
MKRFWVMIFILPALMFGRQKMFDPPLTERIANYTIECRLDPETKIVSGQEVLVWKNSSDRPVDELQFHLYQNAFSDEKSSLLSEMPEVPRELIGHWGYCKILSMTLPDGTDLAPNIVFIQPDDGNPHDKTVCSVNLPKPVAPGEELALSITFETKLPPVVSRSGYEKNFFSVTQWFPKIGVYEDWGWNCRQYHSNGEFYSDFGVYDVMVTIPEKYVVGATGVLVAEETLAGSLKKMHYYCEDVHDFAWCADIDFVEFKEDYKGKQIRLLCQKDHVDIAHRFIKAVKVTFDYYGTRYGEYPYPQITVIDSKHRAAGEMEYPTLFQTGNFDTDYAIEVYRAEPLPASDKHIESLTIHEFGHNWWMGMIANNETDHVWIDEGINSYATTVAFEFGIGKYALENHNGEYRTIRDNERYYYLAYPEAATVLQPAWLYRPGWEFFAFTYTKPEMMLLTFHNYFGDAIWGRVMKTFFQRWKFKHPETQDFYDVVHEITGMNFARFFDEYMTTTHTCDFEVEKVEGNKVWIRRNGQLRFPVTILIHFADGSEEVCDWDNVRDSIVYDFSGSAEIAYVKIDPKNIIEFELSKKNNYWIR